MDIDRESELHPKLLAVQVAADKMGLLATHQSGWVSVRVAGNHECSLSYFWRAELRRVVCLATVQTFAPAPALFEMAQEFDAIRSKLEAACR